MDDDTLAQELKRYEIAYCVLTGILVGLLGVLLISSLYLCPRNGDPVRRPFTWMKGAFLALAL
jgi:hypothetical protein